MKTFKPPVEMVYIKDAETVNMICPFNLSKGTEVHGMCVGDRCMAWRQLEKDQTMGRCGRIPVLI